MACSACKCPRPFCDLNKEANDLLKKGFASTEQYELKIETQAIAPNGTKFEPSFTKSKNGQSLTFPFKFCPRVVETTASFSTDENVAISLNSMKSYYGIKPKLDLKTKTSSFTSFCSDLNLEYRREFVTANVKFSLPNNFNLKTSATLVLGNPTLSVGATAEVEKNASSFAVKSKGIAVAYNHGPFKTSFFTSHEDKKNPMCGISYYQPIPSIRGCAIAAQLDIECFNSLNSDRERTITVGATYQPDDSSTFKARLNDKGTIGFAYSQSLSPDLNVTFLSDINAKTPQNLQFGVKLNFKL